MENQEEVKGRRRQEDKKKDMGKEEGTTGVEDREELEMEKTDNTREGMKREEGVGKEHRRGEDVEKKHRRGEVEDVENELRRGEDVEKDILVEDEDGRGKWSNQVEFFLSCLGYAVGFGNVWRFPYLAYKNGGAAFLIPYVIMLLCAGLPLFCMELILGQYISLGPNILFIHLAPIFSGLGWGMVVVSALVTIYYNMILAWALYYTFASFTSYLPWTDCYNDFNSPNCYTKEEGNECRNQSRFFYNQSCVSVEAYCNLGNLLPYNASHCIRRDNLTQTIPAAGVVAKISPSEDFYRNRMLRMTGTTWEDLGELNWEMVGCLALAWLIVAACLIKGVKSSGKVVYVTAILPYVVLIILFGRGITLEGAYKGIEFYILKPNLGRLWEVEVWYDAATQIFYSLGVSLGSLITLASYNTFNNNCLRDAIVIGICNCATSVFAGFVIFSFLGFLAMELGVEVGEVVSSGSGLVFIVYPTAVTLMPAPPVWSILFFIMLITLGLDSQFAMVETVITAFIDQFQSLRTRKSLVVFSLCGMFFLMGLTMCLEGGIYMFELFFFNTAGISVLILAILEVLAIMYFYGFKRFFGNLEEMVGKVPTILKAYYAVCWLFVTPLLLIVILLFSVIFYVPAYWGDYLFPESIQILGWLLCCTNLVFLPLGFLYAVVVKGKRGRELLTISEDVCPAHVRNERKRKAAETSGGHYYMEEGNGMENLAYSVTEGKFTQF